MPCLDSVKVREISDLPIHIATARYQESDKHIMTHACSKWRTLLLFCEKSLFIADIIRYDMDDVSDDFIKSSDDS